MIADQVRAAYSARDLDALAGLLAEDVTWGDPGFPRSCANRGEVLSTFRRVLGAGATGEVVSVTGYPGGVVAHLRTPEQERWQALVVRDERIVEIRGYDDPDAAAEAVGGR